MQATDSTAPVQFSRDQLFTSIWRSCQHRPNAIADASALTDTCISQLVKNQQDGRISPKLIAQTIAQTLSNFDQAAVTHYKAFHATAF